MLGSLLRTVTTWSHPRSARRRPKALPSARRCRPQLEGLEDRTLLSQTDVWTGTGAVIPFGNSRWTNPLNWSGLAAPQPGDALVFPDIQNALPAMLQSV